ncbi:hypothetical protein AB4114_11070 [Paenibacillus sp. 2RAB27]|uniref:phage baseplate plug family protein n=1 Tax=Paenibacillus sp. 2RAB27 TaxID=3232991 RepID=UPI003F96C12C
MAYKVVPLTSNPNQSFTCTLPVDGKNITLSFTFRYNVMAEYWFMSVTNFKTKELLLDAVPLITGDYPAANLLEQYEYMNIGSAFVVPTNSLAIGIPDDTNIGTEYVLVWGDTFVS